MIDYTDGLSPSCPSIKIKRLDSIWLPPDQPNDGLKVIYLYRLKLTTSSNVLHIDNAKLNISFSAPSVFLKTPLLQVQFFVILWFLFLYRKDINKALPSMYSIIYNLHCRL